MSARYLSASIDGSSSRLLWLCQGVALSGILPTKDSAKNLVDLAKGVRMLAQAREYGLAKDSLADCSALAKSSTDHLGVRAAFDRVKAELDKALEYEIKKGGN